MELRKWWQVIWKRRFWWLLVFLFVTGALAVYAVVTPPTYQATSKVLVEQKGRGVAALSPEMADFTALSSVSRTGNPLDTQKALAASSGVAQAVIDRLKLVDASTGEPLAAADFLDRGKVGIAKGTDILELSFKAPTAAEAQKVADAWAVVFIEKNKEANQAGAMDAAKFISQQLEKTKKELQAAETALRNFKQRNQAVDLTEEARVSVLSLTNLEADIRQAAAAHHEANTRAAQLRSQIGLDSKQALASSALSQDSAVQQLKQQLLEAETDLSNLALGASHPAVRERQERIRLIERKLAERSQAVLGRQYGTGVSANLDPVRQGLTRDLIAAESAALGAKTRVDTLRRLAGNFNSQLSSLPAKEFQLTRLQREAAVAAEQFKLLKAKLEEARIQAAMNVSNATVIEPAALPESPAWPKRFLLLAMGMGLGTLLGLALVFFLEYLEETIQTIEDAETLLKLPTLGLIPWIKSPERAQLVAMLDPRSPATESYRTLRTNLKFIAESPLHTLAITSAGSGEGKSTAIANLAITYAQVGKRVLLVDADMRLPTQHTIFKLPHARGLANVLRGEASFEAAVQATAQPNLDVLVCGPTPEDPAELIDCERMGELIEAARALYDVVLFDAPPIVAVTDASLLAARLDGVILQVGINRVSNRAARHAVRLLSTARVKLLGMVIAGIRPDGDPYYDSYYHRYYGRLEDRKPAKKSRPA